MDNKDLRKIAAMGVVGALTLVALAPAVAAATDDPVTERNIEWLLDKWDLREALAAEDGTVEDLESRSVALTTGDGIRSVTFGELLERFGERSARADLQEVMSEAGDGEGAQVGDIWIIDSAFVISSTAGHTTYTASDCPSPTVVAGQPMFVPVDPQLWVYPGWVHSYAKSDIPLEPNGFGSHIGWTTKDAGTHTGLYSYTGPVSDLFCATGHFHIFDLHISLVVWFPFADGVSVQTATDLPEV